MQYLLSESCISRLTFKQGKESALFLVISYTCIQIWNIRMCYNSLFNKTDVRTWTMKGEYKLEEHNVFMQLPPHYFATTITLALSE